METYLVGGAVRDKLLGYPFSERDWVVVGATASELIADGYEPVGRDFPVFLHPQSKEEYALARTERKTGSGYTGFECFSSPDVTLEEDLKRRDLTINAMAESAEGEIFDPYGGQRDLQTKCLRHVSDAFAEDPLRVLRIARFIARYAHLGFTIADETLNLMHSIADNGELLHLVPERIWKELQRSLLERSPEQFFLSLEQCDALPHLFPELINLSPSDYLPLRRAASSNACGPVRLAVLLRSLTQQQCLSLCKRIKAPNEYRELAITVNNHAHEVTGKQLDAEQLFTLIEQTDAIRRPERFENFLLCCELIAANRNAIAASTQRIRQALHCSLAITAQPLLEQGIKGKALGEALRQERIKAIIHQDQQ